MDIPLAKDVETFIAEQVQSGACPSASALVNDVLRALSVQRRPPFAATDELEAWLLEAADSPTTPLTSADFDGIRARARTRVGDPAA